MKVLLITIAIGDKYLEEYNKLFRQSQKDYADKCGYDFIVITDFIDNNNRHRDTISFNKILVCSPEWANNYDFIIFIDADILININSPPLHNYCDFEDGIGIADEYSQPTSEKRINIQRKMGWETSASDYYKLCNLNIKTDKVLNTGVLVLQPKKHRSFLETIYCKYIKNSIAHKRGYHYEQSCIGYEIQTNKLEKILPNKFNALWGINKLDNDMSLEDFFKDNYFIHFAGKTDLNKVISLHKINKLEK